MKPFFTAFFVLSIFFASNALASDTVIIEQGTCIKVVFTPKSYYQYYSVVCTPLKGDTYAQELKTFDGNVSFCNMKDLAIYQIDVYGWRDNDARRTDTAYHCFRAGGAGDLPPSLPEIQSAVREELAMREATRIAEDQNFWSGIELVNPTDVDRSVILHVGSAEKLVKVPAYGQVAFAGSQFIEYGVAVVWIEGDDSVILKAGWHSK